jgi:UDP-N-acetylmuramate dehydrogenase
VERFEYGYRTSILKQRAQGGQLPYVILDADFGLEPAAVEMLKEEAAVITAKRKASQPGGASCGSVFKNPSGDFAGRLIEEAWLKGRRIGGAQISPLHANFFVNLGQANAADLRMLIDLARQAVMERSGVELELEILLIGEWR